MCYVIYYYYYFNINKKILTESLTVPLIIIMNSSNSYLLCTSVLSRNIALKVDDPTNQMSK